MNLYQEELLEHYQFPRHKGKLLQTDFTSGVHNPSCGDALCFEGRITNGLLCEVGFDGAGCVISQATASMLAEITHGKSLEFIMQLTTTDILALIKIDLGPTRLRCALLSLEALQTGLHAYLSKV